MRHLTQKLWRINKTIWILSPRLIIPGINTLVMNWFNSSQILCFSLSFGMLTVGWNYGLMMAWDWLFRLINREQYASFCRTCNHELAIVHFTMVTFYPLMPKSSAIQGFLCFGDPLLLSVLHLDNYIRAGEAETNVVNIQTVLVAIQNGIRCNHYGKYIMH